jgi:phenylpropionate dioxygenase-like ring-hydroxylating dioxygenase large terminal subunit
VIWADRVGRELRRHVVHGQPIVIYRLESGKIAALQDTCPHRLAPLSLGKLKGDNIECGYHGMTFDCHGKCVLIPGQDIIPGSALVKAYPLAVKYGLVLALHGRSQQGRSEEDLPPASVRRQFVARRPGRHAPDRMQLPELV